MKKIAIIGTGISGLTAAYLLNRKYKITIFEKNDYIGGHTHTHNIFDNNKNIAVDSGFIVFNEATYPNFIKLMKKLNVKFQKTTMGFSVKSKLKNLEYAGNSFSSLFAQRTNIFRLSFLTMLIDIIRFNYKSRSDLNNLSSSETLENYLKRNNFSKSFRENYIIPMGSAIWSTKANLILDMPALFFIRFFDNHGLLQIFNRSDWYVIKGGSNEYVKKIIKNFKSQIRLNNPVKCIIRNEENIIIKYGANEKEEKFDYVVIATHSDQALKMLKNPSENEKKILGALPYQGNRALLHTDISVLPKRKLAWASWNYFLDNLPSNPLSMTYNMNILQNLESRNTYCVSLNNTDSIKSDKIIKNLFYEHPLFTSESIVAQSRRNEINGINNTYYCGAYWRNGFHEDGVVSALDVCKKFDLEL